MRVQYNDNDDNLWCVECKEKIHLGGKYIVVEEKMYDGEIVEKTYHPDHVPEMEE